MTISWFLTAMPPDVRRDSAPPFAPLFIRGCAPGMAFGPTSSGSARTWGVAPNVYCEPDGEAKPRLTSGGRAVKSGGRAVTCGGAKTSGGGAVKSGSRAVTCGGAETCCGGAETRGGGAVKAGGRAVTCGRAVTSGGLATSGGGAETSGRAVAEVVKETK